MNDFAVSRPATDVTRWRSYRSRVDRWIKAITPVGDLLLRLWLAHVFWVSGQTKIQTWDSTLYLFENEYAVPLLPPEWAASVGTFVELAFPILLALGLGGRFPALVLFIFNIVAVVSYPELGAAGFEQHKVWGLMLLVSFLHGPGRLSLDTLIASRRRSEL